jgi:hypothetical protein
MNNKKILVDFKNQLKKNIANQEAKVKINFNSLNNNEFFKKLEI